MILIVDDNRDLCDALAEFLASQGHCVQCAADGDEGLRRLASSQTRPDLVLLDVAMPVLDGWGFLTKMRKKPEFADIPVVMMSGTSDIAERAKELGAVAVARKPIPPEELLAVVHHFVG